MLENSKAYSGIGVEDVEAAQRFYGETLEQRVEVLEEEAGCCRCTWRATGRRCSTAART